MPLIFIHGVPDTYRAWNEVRALLGREDTHALALPGFGTAVPEGFRCTKDEYVAWIITELERFREPVDLVGHDWGCALTVRIASVRPDLVRRWAAGGAPVSKDYEWHALAKIWQTSGKGEEWMANVKPEDLVARFIEQGAPRAAAEEKVSHFDDAMKATILKLYRSAIDRNAEWEPGLSAITAPGLVLWGVRDDACPVAFADALAQSTHARRVVRLDAGHWFAVQRPREVADALNAHFE